MTAHAVMLTVLQAHLDVFAAAASARGSAIISGNPEDAIRSPAETFFEMVARALSGRAVMIVPETPQPDLHVRPDIAILVDGALVGHVELKAPGKGADPRRFTGAHDKTQWAKLKALPNLVYFDGEAISSWHAGKLAHGPISLGHLGTGLTATAELEALLRDVLTWQPTAPRSISDLAGQTARMCRLLRDETSEQLAAGASAVIAMRDDWTNVLAPGADDEDFADGYAQAITFGLLMARARDIALERPGRDLRAQLQGVANDLRGSNTLIGTALAFLSNDPEPLRTSLAMMLRVLDAVHWPTISKGDPEAWLYFYEPFLRTYDPKRHRETGTYYTPPEVVREMVRLTDDALRDPALFGLRGGLAHRDVTVIDPATGTATFLLAILRHIRETVAADRGVGAVPGAIRDAATRLIGFELQFGPFVVGQLRLLADLLDITGAAINPRLYLTNTLGDPDEARARLPSLFAPITTSYAEANNIKRDEPVMVVIGNPPYKDKADGLGGWVEAGRSGETGPMADWATGTGDGAHAKHLKNLYVYFWRWAAWKTWGDGAGGDPNRKGVVCYITAAGFLHGAGFGTMRAELRREADAIWVIDATPEGHQPPVASRLFQGVQQPVCIVMVARGATLGAGEAEVRFRRLPAGPRADKFAALQAAQLDGPDWNEVEGSGGDSFFPAAKGEWARCVPLEAMFGWNNSGVMPGRTWVIAPDRESLVERWRALKAMPTGTPGELEAQGRTFFPHQAKEKGTKKIVPGDRHIDKVLGDGLAGHEARTQSVRVDTGSVVEPIRYGSRSFDRQWIIPDKRLVNRPGPEIWNAHSDRQIHLTALRAHSPSSGPAVTFTDLIPDLDHYNNRGGRAFPLWSDAAATTPNLVAPLLAALSTAHGTVAPEDVMAWIGAIAAHPAYTARFQGDLIRPGLRIPLTADHALWAEGVAIGRRILWLHTYGSRCVDAAAGRPAGPPRAPGGPTYAVSVPTDPDSFPENITYDPVARTLHVGDGRWDDVAPKVWDYEVSGKRVLTQWFGYRAADRTRTVIGDRRPPSPLAGMRPDTWPTEYDEDLHDLLHVLTALIAEETAQADLLKRVMENDIIEPDDIPGVAATAGNSQSDFRQAAMDL